MASQTAINVYPEIVEATGSDVAGFIGTPGLTYLYGSSTISTEVRGLYPVGDYLFAVIGNSIYRINSSYVGTLVGTLTTSTFPVSMTDNGTQLLISDAVGFSVVNLSTLAVTTSITNAPVGGKVAFVDGYGVFGRNIGGTFGLTALNDFTSINALNVATAEGAPDDLITCLVDHREVWLFGTLSIEVWTNTGAAFFPLERAPGGFIEQGCAAKNSPAKIDNSVFWLSADKNGKGMVYRSNVYQPERISTHAIEYAIAQYSTISDAIGFCYQQEGHSFYVLTFPTGDTTWVYDCATKGWHERKSFGDDGYLHRWKVNCHATFNNLNVVGDSYGNIYSLDLDSYTDGIGASGAVEIYRERAWELPDAEHNKVRIDKVELLAMVGDGDSSDIYSVQPNVSLDVSVDAGRTFGYKRQQGMGLIGVNTRRAIWRRKGAGRDWVLRVSTTSRARTHWVGANIKAEALNK